MKTPEAIASELVQKHVQWEEDAECFPQWHVDRSALLISVATAIREARAPVEVSEAELHEIAAAAVKHYDDINGEAFDAYRAGFREAMRQNAVAKLDWPSDDEVFMELSKGRTMEFGGAGELFDSAYKSAIRYLKKRLMGES